MKFMITPLGVNPSLFGDQTSLIVGFWVESLIVSYALEVVEKVSSNEKISFRQITKRFWNAERCNA